MKKYRVYFAAKVHVFRSWFRRKEKIETDYVVVAAHNEAHAVKEAKSLIDVDALGAPFHVTRIEEAGPDEEIGYLRPEERGIDPEA